MKNSTINRRRFLKASAISTAGLFTASINKRAFAAPQLKNTKNINKVIVLGMDGLDPVLLSRFVQRGEMPIFERMMKSSYFGHLGTTMPPQSPVAWSSFISGTNPGGNGIFDFIHRDASTFVPYLSTSRSYQAVKNFNLGKWSIPIKGGKVELLRRGPAFWTVLEQHGIPVTLFKLPADFPVHPGKSRVLSDMGTPDLLGGYGTFTFFSETDVPEADKFTGGRVVRIQQHDHVFHMVLEGPPNSMRSEEEKTSVSIIAYRDPVQNLAKITLQGQEVILKQGEWTGWIPLTFELMPLFSSLSGIVRLYLQQVHPYFKLYVSPIDVDPLNSVLPISSPAGFCAEIASSLGRFYTQGFPEDTKALSNGVFSNDEFLIQTKYVLHERLAAYEYELNKFKEGLFFFYFGSTDQNTHMMWKNMDPSHPLYDPNASPDVKEAVYFFYQKMDDVLKQALSRTDSNTLLLVMSDHGFAPFTREFHLSTWLVENGFTVISDPDRLHEGEFYQYVDWSRTRAYAMGLNGIYINIHGREKEGSVLLRDAENVKKEIQAKLAAVTDPQSGKRIITQVYDTSKIYSGPYMSIAPDLAVGYQSGYRISDEAVLGKFPRGIVGDRTDKWSADHCMDPAVVPGVLLANREVTAANPELRDLGPSILTAFGLPVPAEMDGKPVFK
jgi:predicted AlkP superfamily phosphohydrolase/phosphomutase